MPEPTHGCPGDCGRTVPRTRLACPHCWYRLPRDLQAAITSAYAAMRRNRNNTHAIQAHRAAVTNASTGTAHSPHRRPDDRTPHQP